MSATRRLCFLTLYFFAIHLRWSIGGNPRDSAHIGGRNAYDTTSVGKNSSNTIACQEDVLDQCPPNASCDKGQCVCLFGYKLNPAYHGKNASQSSPTAPATSNSVVPYVYCLLDESSHKSATTNGGSRNSSNAAAEGIKGTENGHAGQLPLREPVAAHHILGGVLIPLAFVVILIGSAFLAKRTDLWSRLRQRFLAHRNRHRRRPAYEDVVLVGFEPQMGRL
ncbi:uncharacterized protein LOC128726885 [Anopheles nili]|uniref:uncharacterized protein LOC128726885 n=1 Tax=Anopheles nili TaxID=185578 RepID=UPI00237B6B0F|nr:uncharacterized protein LOC128726885 [Anopheles nili]